MQRHGAVLLFVSSVTLAPTAVAPARAAEETARQILDRRKALDDGERRWMDRQGRLKVTTTDPARGGRVVELMAYERRYPGDEKKTVLFVRSPGDMKGAGILAFTHKSGPGEHWRYRPDGHRLEQITAASRSDPVAGSDLTFGDLDVLEQMPTWTEADARTTLRGEEGIDSVATYAIEFVPLRADIGYKRIVLWLGRDDMVPREIDLFGEGPYPMKRIRATTIQSQGVIPWIERLEIETPAAHSRTVIEATNVVFNRKVDDDLFSPQALPRGER
jgi:uncharacterized protein